MAGKILLKYFPLLLLVLNICLISINLTVRPISIDEPFSIYHAQFSIKEIIAHLITGNNPPLFEIILHFWIKLFGISPVSVRILPALFASLSAVALFFFAKKNFSIAVGIASSLLLTFSDLMLFYACDCRVYSLFVLLTILSFYFFLEILNNNNYSSKIFFIICTTLLIYAHYFGLFVLFFQILYLLLYKRKGIFSLLVNYIIIAVLYSPYIIVLFTQFFKSSTGVNWLSPPTSTEALYNMLWVFSNAPVPTTLCIILLVVTFLKNIIGKTIPQPISVLLSIWFLFPFLGMFILSYLIPMYLPRYIIFALPAYYILVCLCAENLFLKKGYNNIILILLMASFIFSHRLTDSNIEALQKVTSIIKEHKSNKTLLLINSSLEEVPFVAYHYNQTFFSSISDGKSYHQTDSLLRTENIYWNYNTNDSVKFDTLIYLSFAEKTKPQLQKIKEEYHNEKEYKVGSNFIKIVFTK